MKAEKFNNIKLITVIIFNLALLFGLIQSLLGPLIPIFVKEFNIGYEKIGLLFFVGLFFAMISAGIFGRLSDRFARNKIIIIGIIFLILGMLGFIILKSLIFFIISFCVLNLGFGCLEAGITTSIIEIRRKENRSLILTTLHKFLGLGSLVGPLILAIVIYFRLGWRLVFILTLINLTILSFIFIKTDYPDEISYKGYEKVDFKSFLNVAIIVGSFILFFFVGVNNTFAIWFTTYFSFFKVKTEFSSLFLSFYWSSILLGRILTQKIIKRIDERKLLIIFVVASTIILFVIAFSNNLIIKIISSFLLGLSLGGIYPIIFSLMFSMMPKKIGSMFSIIGFIGYSSVMIFNLIIGYFAENFGEKTIIYIQLLNSILLIAFVITLNIIIMSKKNHKKNKIFAK